MIDHEISANVHMIFLPTNPKILSHSLCPGIPSHMISTKKKHAQDPRKMAKKLPFYYSVGLYLNVNAEISG